VTGAAGALAYHDGSFVPLEQASLPVTSLALRYALSVFEGVRLYRGDGGGLRPWLLGAHLERLEYSCRACALEVPGDLARAGEILERLAAANGDADSYARIAVSAANAGDLFTDASPVLTVTLAGMGRKRWVAGGAGMRLQVSAWQRPSAAVLPRGAKTIAAYAGSRVALLEARRAGYDSCLLTTPGGLVSEAPTATVFAVEGSRLVTPRLADGVLPGVTRAWLLALAPALGLEARCEPVPPGRLVEADEVLLCGTGIEVAPVRSVGERDVAGWPEHAVADRVTRSLFAQARGEAPVTAFAWDPGREPAGAA
jgi:branched-chain amino acid aminotransferase